MVARANTHPSEEPPKRGRVLTRLEAFSLLDANHTYLKASDSRISGRHRTEIVAEAMVREGLDGLAGGMVQLHDTMKEFAVGDFKAAQFLAESLVFDRLLEEAASTKFAAAPAAKKIIRAIGLASLTDFGFLTLSSVLDASELSCCRRCNS